MAVAFEKGHANPWRLDYRDEKGVRHRQRFRTKRQLEQFEHDLAERKVAVELGLPARKGPTTLRELVALYEAAHESKRSSVWWGRMIRHATRRFGDELVRVLEPSDIGAWLHSLELSPKTKTHILTALRQVLAAGMEWGYLERNPAGKVKPPRMPRYNPNVVPFETWEQVLAVADQAGEYGPVVRFAAATGLRPQEWRALRGCDVDVERRLLHVNRTFSPVGEVQEGYGKNENAMRTVMLSTAALNALADAGPPPSPFSLLFTTKHGRPIELSNFRKQFVEWCKLAGLKPRPPSQLRHSYATIALAQGAELPDISRQLGHSSPEITHRYYARWSKKVDDRMLAILDSIEPRRGHEMDTSEADAG